MLWVPGGPPDPDPGRPLPLPDPPLADGVVALRPFPRPTRGVAEACRDPEIPRWTEVPSPYGPEDAAGWIAGQAGARARGESLELAIVRRGDPRVAGAIGLSTRARPDRAEVGYWVAPWARRRGVATRALRLLSAWALTELGLARLELLTLPGNAGSGRVARAAGYRREGVLRAWRVMKGASVDLVMYGRAAADPPPPPGPPGA